MEEQIIDTTAKKAEIDKYQAAAINAVQNSVVSAGAGSGKTRVLSERFLHLIKTKGYNADQILTLTFTKKATVEMSDRIYKVLKKSAPEQAAVFYKANINTIDSYCNSVAKEGSRFFGISPDFTSDNDALKELVNAQVYPFILKHRDNQAIKTLVGTKGFDKFPVELFVNPVLNNSTIAEPLDFPAIFRRQISEVVKAWNENCHGFECAANELAGVLNHFDGNRDTSTFKKAFAVIAENELPRNPRLSEDDVWNCDEQALNKLEKYLRSIIVFKKINKPGALKCDESIKESWKKAIDDMKRIWDVLLSLCVYLAGFPTIKELIPLFVEFQDIVNGIKRNTGYLSFQDVSSMAMCILRDHPEIRALEKKKYRAIMIDEFQDNNTAQRDMLFLLAERQDRMEKGVPSVDELCPDKLFFVGDEKQSIYRFRGADVSVFRRLSDEFKNGNLSMHTNYRSHPSLIASFNTIFGGFEYPLSKTIEDVKVACGMAAAEGADDNACAAFDDAGFLPSVFFSDAQSAACRSGAPDYEAVYHKVLIPEDKANALNTREKEAETYIPHVHFALYESGDKNDDKPDEKKYLVGESAEIEWISRKINELIHREKNPVKPSDIAVLFPKTSFQPGLERSFLQHGIPYNTESVTDIFADGPVNDIAAFINLCVNPADRCSYAQVLRSPFVNLSFEDTQKVLSVREIFSEKAASLLGDSKTRFVLASEFYHKISETAKYEPLTQTLTKLWYDSGYRYETMWNNAVQMFSKQYDILFEMARRCDVLNMNIASFSDYLGQYKENGSKLDDMNIPLEQTGGVNIMTIHKSKGLEFEVVFVCGTESGKQKQSNRDLVFSSRDYGISVNTPNVGNFVDLIDKKKNYFFERMRTDNILRSNAEIRRQAYVALTRAKSELYITNSKYTAKDYEKTSESYAPGSEKEFTTVFAPLANVLAFYLKFQEKKLVSGSENCMPFDVEMIPSYSRNELWEASGRRNSITEKKRLINFLSQKNPYATAGLIKAEVPERKYTNPSHLHETDDETIVKSTESVAFSFEVDKNVPYWEIGDIVFSTLPAKTEEGGQPEPKFSFANFGTIAHAYMEAAVTGGEPVIKERDLAGLENRKKAVDTVKSICSEMAEKFKASTLGAEVAECIAGGRFIKAEYSFRSRLKDSILKGTIDLVFENPDGTYTIVDYKTNQSVKPEIYYVQLACYRQAVAAMLGVKDTSTIRCMLYYLRFGEVVDITEPCGAVEIE